MNNSPIRLKGKDVKPTRSLLLEKQSYRCAICNGDCTADQAVLDHDHKGGHVRAVLHRGCNALLGRIENNGPRHGLRGEQLVQFLLGAAKYLVDHQENVSGMIHPTHRTPEEKEAARKAKAKRKRAALKKQVV